MIKQRAISLMLIGIFATKISFAGCEETLKACDEAITAQTAQITNLKELVVKQDEMISKIIEQRNKAYEQANQYGPGIPWYVWTLVGASSAVILVRGIK